jgi:predicted Zn-dependent protease with MMP-like domain
VKRERFERLVGRALDELPEPFQRLLQNVVVVIEQWPSARALAANGLGPDETLFGLYEGTPLTERTSGWGNVVPDQITIFQGPIEAACRTEMEIRREVQVTVAHEIAHFFGIDEQRLKELGLE